MESDKVLKAAELKRLVEEGINSGPSVDGKTAFARLRARYESLARGRAPAGPSR